MTIPTGPEAAAAAAICDIVIRRVHVFDGSEALGGVYDVGLIGQEIAAISERRASLKAADARSTATAGGSCPA